MTKKRILVVDNEQYIQEVTKICLETVASWEVITAIAKPFNPLELASQVAAALGWSLGN